MAFLYELGPLVTLSEPYLTGKFLPRRRSFEASFDFLKLSLIDAEEA